MRGKTVEGADLGLFDVVECRPSTRGNLTGTESVAIPQRFERDCSPVARPHSLGLRMGKDREPLAQPHFHFSGRFVGERQGDDLRDRDRSRLFHKQMHETIHQQSRLAGSRPGYDDDVAIERRLGRLSRHAIRYDEIVIHRQASAREAASALSVRRRDRLSTTSAHVLSGTPPGIRTRRNSRPEE